MERNAEIPVGRGRVVIENSLQEYAGKGYYIVLRIESRQGPCNDVDCQRILDSVVEVAQVPDPSYRIFAGEGYFLAVDPVAYTYIDRDRQSVTIRKSVLGKLSAKGLSF